MPCHSCSFPPEPKGMSPEKKEKKLNKEIDELTQMLCLACRIIEREKPYEFTTNLQKWWNHHKKMDEDRIAKEEAETRKKELKAKAIAKLSKDELEALGLNEAI